MKINCLNKIFDIRFSMKLVMRAINKEVIAWQTIRKLLDGRKRNDYHKCSTIMDIRLNIKTAF